MKELRGLWIVVVVRRVDVGRPLATIVWVREIWMANVGTEYHARNQMNEREMDHDLRASEKQQG